jgi:hypothetical protein
MNETTEQAPQTQDWQLAQMSGQAPPYSKPCAFIYQLTLHVDEPERDRWLAGVKDGDSRVEDRFRDARDGNADLATYIYTSERLAKNEGLLAYYQGEGARAQEEYVRLIRVGEDEKPAADAWADAKEKARLQNDTLGVLRKLVEERYAAAKSSVEQGAEQLRRELREQALARAAELKKQILEAVAPYLADCLAAEREAELLSKPLGFGYGNSAPWAKFARFGAEAE